MNNYSIKAIRSFLRCLLVLICFLSIISCEDNLNSVVKGYLAISPFEKSTILIGDSSLVIVSLNNSSNINYPVTVKVSSSNPEVATISPSSCFLTKSNSSCAISVNAISKGKVTISANATGYLAASTNPLNIVTAAPVIGNDSGLVYLDEELLEGAVQGSLVDGNDVTGIIIDKQGDIYVTTTKKNYRALYKYNFSNKLWMPLVTDLTSFGSYILCMAMNSRGDIYAGTQGDVLFWNKNSSSFREMHLGDGSAIIYSIIVDKNDNVYAGTNDGYVYKLAKGDENWTVIGGGKVDNSEVEALAIDTNDDIYVGTYNGLVYKLAPDGNSWVSLGDSGLDPYHPSIKNVIVDSKGNLYILTSDNTLFTLEYGKTSWASIDKGAMNEVTIFAIACDNKDKLYAATRKGLYKMVQTSQWELVGQNIDTSGAEFISFNNNDIYIGTGDGAIGVLTQGNSKWEYLGLNSLNRNRVVSTAIDVDRNVYAGTYNGKVFKFLSGTHRWVQLGEDEDSTMIDLDTILVARDNNIYAKANWSLFKFDSSASVWDLFSSGKLPENQDVIAFALDKNSNLYATDKQGLVYVWDKKGLEWKALGTTGLDNSQVVAITVNSNGQLYAGTNNSKVYTLNTNNLPNSTWKLVGNGPATLDPIVQVVADAKNKVYVLTALGDVFTLDDSNTWYELTSELVGNSFITALTIDDSDNLYLGNDAGALFKYDTNDKKWVKVRQYNSGSVINSLSYGARPTNNIQSI